MSTPHHVRLLRGTSILCALSVLLVNSHNLLSDSQTLGQSMKHVAPPVAWYLTSIYASGHMLVLLGLLAAVAAIYRFGQERYGINNTILAL